MQFQLSTIGMGMRVILASLGLSFLLLQYQIWLIAVGLHTDLGFWVFFQAMLIANIVAMVPITVAGLGTREFGEM